MKTGFFEEQPGTQSMIRLMSFIFCIWSVVASGYVFVKNTPAEGIAVFTALSGIAITGKLIQKPNEKPMNNENHS